LPLVADTYTLDSVSQGSLSYRYRRECEWQTLEGDFVCINAATKSCRCEKAPEGMSPASHLSDGCTDLILVRSSSRLDYVRHMYRYTTSKYDQVRRPLCVPPSLPAAHRSVGGARAKMVAGGSGGNLAGLGSRSRVPPAVRAAAAFGCYCDQCCRPSCV